ncbi:TOMM precursor leader peptide-binding protein [Micromonospora sp. WMMD967]|uniref:TOMM precursor leader peptide-binding protein n=1 Tax=Micromonospora sp. WMMD967 TaxID=3016101 RepID=UPI002417F2A8|nr:TOMM precursor leader peptide-binding protein [Micromonospora sp. WMMD967]MDG4836592.1 TOMM precursor leader peptide-binding protein [Micromonospora sp. WMMD967]
MATAVRLTTPAAIVPDQTALLGIGPFGRRVTGLLARMTYGTQVPPDDAPETAFAGTPSALVVALWRPSPALCDRIDERSHATGVPWLPVVLEPSHLRIGPLVVPGAGPCHGCFEERRAQHDPHWPGSAALYAAYDRNPACGPAGFLPQHARTAAGLALRVLGRPDVTAGRVISVPLRGVSVRQDPVLACHGCPRCGRPLPERDLRTLLRLKKREDAGVR